MDFVSPRPPLRRPKRQALSSVCNVSQAMTNVHPCKGILHLYISVYYHVYLCSNVCYNPWSFNCKSESGWPEPQAKLCQTGCSEFRPLAVNKP